MQIKYGSNEFNIDVTDICLSKLTNDNIINIPQGDFYRSYFFSDPLIGILKKIFIIDNDLIQEFDHNQTIKINLKKNMIDSISNLDINKKVADIQSKLKLNYGVFSDELPEQKIACRYITGKEKILEIGGNIGRNSLIMSSILEDSSNLVVLETETYIANQLCENRNNNNFKFHIENAALSKRKLIQQGHNTYPSEILQEGFHWIKTITYNELKKKYDINFDTLVLDCEGAFYYILNDMPEILDNINLIIMENDYLEINHKKYIDEKLRSRNFYRDYFETGGWGPCYEYFYEVWKRKETLENPEENDIVHKYDLKLKDEIHKFELRLQEEKNNNINEIIRLKNEIESNESKIQLLDSKIQLLESKIQILESKIFI